MVCLRDAVGSPEWARWLHLARSGSQSQRAIWFILPARGASHIIRSYPASSGLPAVSRKKREESHIKMTGILVVLFGGNRSGLGGGLGIPRVFSLYRFTCTAGAFVAAF